jgi:hypothetical protein
VRRRSVDRKLDSLPHRGRFFLKPKLIQGVIEKFDDAGIELIHHTDQD